MFCFGSNFTVNNISKHPSLGPCEYLSTLNLDNA